MTTPAKGAPGALQAMKGEMWGRARVSANRILTLTLMPMLGAPSLFGDHAPYLLLQDVAAYLKPPSYANPPLDERLE